MCFYISLSMEIGEINKLSKAKPLQRSERSMAPSKIEDRVSFSPQAIEAQKKARFVEMLKEMPEVISLNLNHSQNMERVIATKIYQEFK